MMLESRAPRSLSSIFTGDTLGATRIQGKTDAVIAYLTSIASGSSG
jgi:hypothetical protein